MNNRFLITTLVAGSILLTAGCSDDSPFEPAGSNTNNGLVSQNNFTILFNPTRPEFFDKDTKSYTSVTSEISVQIGDNNNQLITGSHTIFFRTEWGLIDPSCITENGGCSVTWRSGSPDTEPADHKNTIVAYTATGEESFGDVNGNGIFDNGDEFNTDLYADVQEPFVNADESFSVADFSDTFTAGDTIIDTINGIDLTGADGVHNDGDSLYNGSNCAHSTLCSTVRSTVTVWESGTMILFAAP